MRRGDWGAIDYAVAAFWLSLVTCLGTVVALTIFGMLIAGNTRTHDALRTDEQGTKDAILKLDQTLTRVAEAIERESGTVEPGVAAPQDHH